MRHSLLILILAGSLLVPPPWIEKIIQPWLPPATALTVEEAYSIAAFFGAESDLTIKIRPDVGEGPNAMFTRQECVGEFGEFNQDPMKPCTREAVIVIEESPLASDIQHTILLLHELGHYWQWKQGTLTACWWFVCDLAKKIQQEWDADVFGVNAACRIGLLTAPAEYQAFFTMLRERFGYTGDPWHGDSRDRVEYFLNRADHCVPKVETP